MRRFRSQSYGAKRGFQVFFSIVLAAASTVFDIAGFLAGTMQAIQADTGPFRCRIAPLK